MILRRRGEAESRAGRRSFWATWFNRRALALHLLVALVAPGCAVAGWWQATRALAGNGLSWVYSIEWPVFALLAIWGWWHLVHEDPEAYAARKAGPTDGADPGETPGELRQPRNASATVVKAQPGGGFASPGVASPAGAAGPVGGAPPSATRRVDPATEKLSTILVLGIALEFVIGVISLVVIPVGRPSGWIPAEGGAAYLIHALSGAVLFVGGMALVVRASSPSGTTTGRAVAWTGLIGLGIAGAGGLLTAGTSVARFFGMALMFLGTALAGVTYLVPAMLVRSSRRKSVAEAKS